MSLNILELYKSMAQLKDEPESKLKDILAEAESKKIPLREKDKKLIDDVSCDRFDAKALNVPYEENSFYLLVKSAAAYFLLNNNNSGNYASD